MEKLSGMFILDPGSGSGFFHIPDPRVESIGYRIRIRNTDFLSWFRRFHQSLICQSISEPIKFSHLTPDSGTQIQG
jgi:hypothetical protein